MVFSRGIKTLGTEMKRLDRFNTVMTAVVFVCISIGNIVNYRSITVYKVCAVLLPFGFLFYWIGTGSKLRWNIFFTFLGIFLFANLCMFGVFRNPHAVRVKMMFIARIGMHGLVLFILYNLLYGRDRTFLDRNLGYILCVSSALNCAVSVIPVIKGLAGDHTVMISTHILSEAQLTCERVIVINQGQIVAEDSRQELTHRLREADVVFLRVKNTPPAVRRELQAMREVRAVRPEEDGGEGAGYYIEASVGADLRSDLAEVAVKQEWGLLELRRVDMTLEDAFIELTREEAATRS